MKRTLCGLMALLLIISLCACGKTVAEPEPTPTPKPLSETDKWALNVLARYNMDYSDFAEYWSLLCDNYFGEDFVKIINILSDCESVDFSLEDKNAEIEAKRSEYEKKYGEGWCFEYGECVTEPLEARANEDFAAELESLYEDISVLTESAAGWGDSEWSYFAEGLGCSVDTAKELVSLYASMGEKCHEAKVEDASSVTVVLTYGETEERYDTWLYRVNGVLVSQELIDSSLALINLIY